MQQLIAARELPADQPQTRAVARAFNWIVQAIPAHHQQCPYCKCQDCKTLYSKIGPFNPAELTVI